MKNQTLFLYDFIGEIYENHKIMQSEINCFDIGIDSYILKGRTEKLSLLTFAKRLVIEENK